MSKAFTREDDVNPDDPIALPQRPILPPGSKNYITRSGLSRLQARLDQLIQTQRSQDGAETDDTDSKRRLKIIDHQSRVLQQSIETAVVVDPPADRDTVRFGATVTATNCRGEELTWRIVGIDETDPDQGRVSWLSPIAKALLNARKGQKVPFHFPAGKDTLEVTAIHYE